MFMIFTGKGIFATKKGAAYTAADAMVVGGGIECDEFCSGSGHDFFLLEVDAIRSV
jgi:hypothetical protein